MNIKRIFVEKKDEFNIEAVSLIKELKEHLLIAGIESLRILYRYDIENISKNIYEFARKTIFSEPPVDLVYDENFLLDELDKYFTIEYLPGQYDQRADSASQCIQILTQGERPSVKCAKVIIVKGNISDDDFQKIKSYLINPVDSREATNSKPKTLIDETIIPNDVSNIDNFILMDEFSLSNLLSSLGLAMDLDDLKFCQKYFRDIEKRDPTITEMKILDTYWSDHCRHTTFSTTITDVEFENGKISNKIKETYEQYLQDRQFVYGEKIKQREINFMDIATLAMKKLKKEGKLAGFDESEEINACSIEVKVDIDGKDEDWLVMFKNETHNHPTEIEPFGGAATCLGGAIRDPLSGRAYVYQAMRVTGSGDPRVPINETIDGKLPQRRITTEAAHGYSSYGNQIGLSTGLVDEIYHPGYVAKRMEIGAVIAAVPKYNVVREKPSPGDVIILLGGKTGRDGCGGATGSSKAHTKDSIISCGAEVQKGNAPEERKIQRLFRNPEVTRMIKRCNDFGAGGVSVAVGELAKGLEINLDAIPKKYEGLDGTELAISESQERMACVIAKENEIKFKIAASKENIETSTVAEVNETKRVKMFWRGKTIVNISREFLDSNGATKNSKAKITEPKGENYFNKNFSSDIKPVWLKMLANLNVANKKGLVERFDNCVGAATVNYPFGGKFQLTPTESMTAKIPTLINETMTGTIMSYGFNPFLSSWSPFHGAVYAVVESVAKIVASGGNYKSVWFSFQEYFERLGDNPTRWGKPMAALLGAYYAQSQFERAAIGGKDSMSGSFNNLDVPPTLVSFAVDTTNLKNIISPEFKNINSNVIFIPVKLDENYLPDFKILKANYEIVAELVKLQKVNSIHTVRGNGVAEAISKMSFGNKIGFKFDPSFNSKLLFQPAFGGLILELKSDVDSQENLANLEFVNLGNTILEEKIIIDKVEINLEEAISTWSEPLEDIFPTKVDCKKTQLDKYKYDTKNIIVAKNKVAKPRVLIPVFPGTNSEYDSAKIFEKAGAITNTVPVRNLTPKMLEETIDELAMNIKQSQIIFIPGGFSAGDEPEGSGKFIATMFRNPQIKDAVMDLLKNREGLMLGICNGFQALIKLGLVPYGEIREIDETTPTLTFNKIGRHISKIIYTKTVSNLSPWLNNVELGTVQAVPVSHGEGRFVANNEWLSRLKASGQIVTQYVDFDGNPTMDIFFNPNSSNFAIEGITSPDGRVFGKMGHNERLGNFVGQNIPGNKEIKLFEAGVEYFK
ncbi:MAG: phosphoribosylformylglycinamidine synthase [Ignavibacteriales bacterium CG18_big_fil_WC_8_21_14_2_50_31_20]|nr:MAG: phosphoribosylformylglycinamidine synthase [Ignavibacteriales bacterium CG18_big_fil_WC_8_21_14_2_50_31_20]